MCGRGGARPQGTGAGGVLGGVQRLSVYTDEDMRHGGEVNVSPTLEASAERIEAGRCVRAEG